MLLGAALGKEVQEHTEQCDKLTFHFTAVPHTDYAFHKRQGCDYLQRPCRFCSVCDRPLKGDNAMSGRQEQESWMVEIAVTQSRHRMYTFEI